MIIFYFLFYFRFLHLGLFVVIDRLINRNHHFLALKISQSLKLKTQRILMHWASEKVKSSKKDKMIKQSIINKLANVPGISYAEIASVAFKNGKAELAKEVTNFFFFF